jgi:N-acetylglutamate synthase-like GNAT family acetyltransferase
MTLQVFKKHDYSISSERSKIDIDMVHRLLSKSHWAANRKRETVVKSIENSLCYGVYHNERQVGFARIITDYCTFAHLCDVIIEESCRGQGLAKWLLDCIMKNPDLLEVLRFTLSTKDAHGLYEKFGFTSLSDGERHRLMSISKDES